MLDKLLVYRLLILNICGLPLIAKAWYGGVIDKIVLSDSTYISHLIVVVFLVGLASVFIRAGKISAILDDIKNGRAAALPDEKIRAKAEHIDDISAYLVRLGLIGTVVGFAMALDIKDVGSITSASGVLNLIAGFLSGMKVAVHTTIVGAVLSLWLDLNARFLKTATECALFDARDTFEKHSRALRRQKLREAIDQGATK